MVRSMQDCMLTKNGVKCINSHHLHFLFNLPATKLDIVKDEIDAVYNDLLDINNHVYHLNQSVATREITLCYDSYIVKGKRKKFNEKAKLYLHIYYNKQISQDNYNKPKFPGVICNYINRYASSSDKVFGNEL